MTNKTMGVALAALLLSTAAQAQICPCNGGVGTLIVDTASLVRQRMACGMVGSEKWSEYHAINGDLVDYKLGPGHPADPTSKVGGYNTQGPYITYAYPGSQYSYNICAIGSPTTSYTFCTTGGGRDIPGIIIGPSAPQAAAISCAGLNPVNSSATTGVTRAR